MFTDTVPMLLMESYLLIGLRKCTTVLSSLNMLTSSMSERGCTPTPTTDFTRIRRLTELLHGSFQLLVLTDGLGGDNLLGSSLGAYSDDKLADATRTDWDEKERGQ